MYRHAARLVFLSVAVMIGATVADDCLGQLSPGPGATAQAAPASWTPTGNLNTARSAHSATLLPNGKVLAVGGRGDVSSPVLGSAELYDPATGTWSVTGGLNMPRTNYPGLTATFLSNGKVLVAGGDTISTSPDFGRTATAELYDPSTGAWSFTGTMTTPRSGHTTTLLSNGKILVSGGYLSDSLASAELYDPATGSWSPTGNLIDARYGHTATLLQSGKVLVAGGAVDNFLGDPAPQATAELYDPVAGTWSSTGRLVAAAFGHSATLLPSGRVLVAGGYRNDFLPNGGGGFSSNPMSLDSSQLYDPATGTWRATGSLNASRQSHTATLLPNGMVLVAGGYDYTSRSDLTSAELYDEATGTWSYTASLNAARNQQTATLLTDGRVLAAGGNGVGPPLSSAELYTPVAPPANNSYRMTAIFSDQAGLYQYIQLQNLASPTQPNHFAGLTLTVTTRAGAVKRFVFPKDAASTTQPLCIATANVLPGASGLDFVIPDLFIPTDGGTINFAGVDTWTFGPLSADGHSVLLRNGISPSGVLSCSTIAFFLAVPQDPVIEYYSAVLDHYFMSASQPDLDALDSGRIPGWKRTGYSFPVWITRYVDPAGEFGAPGNVVDVCRIYIPPVDGDSHFFSASASECSGAQAQHPEFVLETTSAFLVTLPNPQTGACPPDQEPVYRLWNGRADSNHRYTTSIAVRDQMKARGYIAEGYGPDAVAMCAGGNI